jgi:hypothetical protein
MSREEGETRLKSFNLLMCSVFFLVAAPLSHPAYGASKAASALPIVSVSDLPDWVREKPDIIEAYRFAAANPEILKKIPCYCGCVAAGHKSNYDCYVKEVRPDGSIVFDRHGSY